MGVLLFLSNVSDDNLKITDTADFIDSAKVIESLEDKNECILGRNAQSIVSVKNCCISDLHCKLECKDNKLYVKNLGIGGTEYFDFQNNCLRPIVGDTEIQLVENEINILVLAGVVKICLLFQEANKSSFQEQEIAEGEFDKFLLEGVIATDADFKIKKLLKWTHKSFIYEAEQISFKRTVVVKTLSRSLKISDGKVKRFQRKSQIASLLSHNKLPQIYNRGNLYLELNNCNLHIPYIVMEYIEGTKLTLEEFVKKNGCMEEKKALRLITGIAKTVEYMHERDIFHQNLSPLNILVDETGNLKKVIGTSFLKIKEKNPEELEQLRSQTIIQLTLIVPAGTIGFSSPESLLGEEKLDHRTDIYSIGAIYYYCLKGEAPYGKSIFELEENEIVADYILNQIKKLDEKGYPNEIIENCLKYKKEKRYSDIEVLCKKLTWDDQQQEKILNFYGLFPEVDQRDKDIELAIGYGPYEELGGDFYTYKKLDENKTFFAIGDWRGHGSNVAVLVGLAVGALNVISQDEFCPSKILEKLHLAMIPSIERGMFAEVTCGIIDTYKQIITYSHAGRIPIICVGEDSVHWDQPDASDCCFIGTMGKFSSKPKEVKFTPGDTLLSFSDGIFEHKRVKEKKKDNDSNLEFFSLENIQTLTPGRSPREIINRIVDLAQDFSDEKDDDTTILCVKSLQETLKNVNS